MKLYLNKKGYSLMVLLSLFLCGCSFFKNAGRDLVTGAREELGKPETGEVFAGLTARAGEGVGRSIPGLDSLLRAHTAPLVAELRDELLGETTRSQVAQLRDEVLGEATQIHLAMLREELLGEAFRQQLAMLRDELLGEATRRHVASFRNDLLGATTDTLARALVAGLITSLAQSYESNLRPIILEDLATLKDEVQETGGFLTENAKTLVWSLVAGVAILLTIIGFFVLRYFRGRKMLKLVTKEIDEIGDATVKKDLTNRIKDKALETGLQPHLHKVILEQRTTRKAA